MRRIIISIFLGFVFPAVCMMIIGAMEDYLPESLTELKFYDKVSPGILWLPFTIPLYLQDFLVEERIIQRTPETIWLTIILFILFDWILYGMIIYLILGRLKRFKKRSTPTLTNPPPPPPTF